MPRLKKVQSYQRVIASAAKAQYDDKWASVSEAEKTASAGWAPRERYGQYDVRSMNELLASRAANRLLTEIDAAVDIVGGVIRTVESRRRDLDLAVRLINLDMILERNG